MYVSHSQVGKQDDVPTKSININENRCIWLVKPETLKQKPARPRHLERVPRPVLWASLMITCANRRLGEKASF
jgi:hypothetical protein